MSKTILVVGATGNYGQPVTRQLAKDGFDVRVFTRKREKAEQKFGTVFPIFEGNVEDNASLRQALEGCYGVHLNMRGWWHNRSHDRIEHLGTANVIRLGKEAGVERLTYLSDIHAREEYSYLPHLKAKLDAERVISESGIPFAIFACSFFMENAHHLAKRTFILAPVVTNSYHYIAAADYAAMVSRTFQLPEAPNRRFDVYGPEAIPAYQASRNFCRIVRPGTRMISFPLWAVRLHMHLTKQVNRQYAMKAIQLYRKHGEPGDASKADYGPLPRPTTTHREWCEAQRDKPLITPLSASAT